MTAPASSSKVSTGPRFPKGQIPLAPKSEVPQFRDRVARLTREVTDLRLLGDSADSKIKTLTIFGAHQDHALLLLSNIIPNAQSDRAEKSWPTRVIYYRGSLLLPSKQFVYQYQDHQDDDHLHGRRPDRHDLLRPLQRDVWHALHSFDPYKGKAAYILENFVGRELVHPSPHVSFNDETLAVVEDVSMPVNIACLQPRRPADDDDDRQSIFDQTGAGDFEEDRSPWDKNKTGQMTISFFIVLDQVNKNCRAWRNTWPDT